MKKIRQYKGFTIKITTKTDDKNIYTFVYYVYNSDMELEFECDNLTECIENIDSY